MANIDSLYKAQLGQYGSTFISGTGDVDLTGGSASKYVIAITILTSDTKFAALECLNGEVGAGISTVTAENDLDGVNGFGASANGTNLSTSLLFPAGLTIYGKWDKVTLGAGQVIVYFAPQGY
tara:strand:+ start:15258 stop:15626 length:369 start_codon:yes stop_codon:yes gene_type:complete